MVNIFCKCTSKYNVLISFVYVRVNIMCNGNSKTVKRSHALLKGHYNDTSSCFGVIILPYSAHW